MTVQPISSADRFDLVLAMEFTEHVAEERAEALVAFIARMGTRS